MKELTPEFFCQPEFLRNSNAFRLGTRQACPDSTHKVLGFRVQGFRFMV